MCWRKIPDLFIVSRSTKADIVALIKEAGIPVARPNLEDAAEGHISQLLLMGYMLGAEERALELVAEIEERLNLVAGRVPPPGDASRPAVISITRWSDSISRIRRRHYRQRHYRDRRGRQRRGAGRH